MKVLMLLVINVVPDLSGNAAALCGEGWEGEEEEEDAKPVCVGNFLGARTCLLSPISVCV